MEQLAKRQWGNGMGDDRMPSLWVFLIIVLGALLALVVGTSFVMHMIQRHQRKVLARRIANGEVDLEMLGLKRMNVPREQVDKMPQYVWTFTPAETIRPPEPAAKTEQHRHSAMFAQTTCSICLDDFEENVTMVRELPCNHIFHPECIDPFLVNNSSLCPLCKKSAMPAGVCPIEVTNIMVRRERLGRAMREQRARRIQDGNFPASQSSPRNRRTPASETVNNQTQDTELGVVTPRNTDSEEPPPEIARQGREARRAWRRERLARQHSQEFDQQDQQTRLAEERRPWWRRWMGLT